MGKQKQTPPAPSLPDQVVAPFETAEGWAVHLAAQIEALAPADAAELAIVERVAGLLWRLRRVERWEGRPLRLDAQRWQKRRVEDAAERRAHLVEIGRPELAELVAYPLHPDDLAGSLAHVGMEFRAVSACIDGPPDRPLTRDEATVVIYALAIAANRVEIEGRPLPGLPAPFNELEGAPPGIAYTVAMARRWAAALARRGKVEGGAAALWEATWARVMKDYRETHRAAQETAEQLARAQVAADSLPSTWGNLARYEQHLSGQLAQALGQLERLQGRRGAGPAELGPLPVTLGRLDLPAPVLPRLPAPPSARELLAGLRDEGRVIDAALSYLEGDHS